MYLISRQKEALELRSGLTSIAIVSPAQIQVASETLVTMNTRLAEIESKRSAIVDPINAALKAINGLFNPPIKAYKDAVADLKTTIGRANSDMQTRNREIMQQQAVLLANNQVREASILHAELAAKPVTEGVRTREVLSAEVIDPNAVPISFCMPDIQKIMAAVSSGEFEVPRKYCSQDIEKIKMALKNQKDKLNIPGVKVVIGTLVTSSRGGM